MKARFQDGCDGGMPVTTEKRFLTRSRLFRVLALALAATVADAATVHTAEPPADVTVVDAGNAGPEEREVTRRITVLLQAADAGEPTAQKVYEAAELGMAALWEAAGRMNLDQETHRAPFILLAEQTAAVRRTQRELLRLYDPPAYRAFYTPDGSRLQARIARALQWKNPPANLLAAMVLAAPEPTLAWLEAQDEEALREPARLLEILRVWGGVVALGREHAFIQPLRAVGERLARSPAVNANDRLLVGVIRFLGDLNCRGAAESVTAWLEHPNAAVRRAAVETLGRLRGDTALNALIDRVPKETDAEAQGLLANALGRWPGDPAAGDACLDLYARSPSQEARRSVLNAAGRATWPARDPLVRRAFEHRDGGALIALAIKPVPGLEDGLLQRLHESEGRLLDPSLLDALAVAQVAAATPALVQAFNKEQNIAMRLKLIFALETLGGNEAGAALLKRLDDVSNELETEYVITALGRMRHVGAVPRLARLARDAHAPISVRIQAIWALGCLPHEEARATLEDLWAHVAQYFGTSGSKSLTPDQAVHLRVVSPHILLARFRQGVPAARDEIDRAFAEGGPIEQTTFLAGIRDQRGDHPIIAKGLESGEFAVLYMAIAAARAANPGAYGPRVRQLAASPYIQALADIALETWDLRSLLEGWP